MWLLMFLSTFSSENEARGKEMVANMVAMWCASSLPSIDSITEAIRNLGLKLITKMEDLHKPLVDQLEEIKSVVERTRQIAKSAVELVQMNQEDIKVLQASGISTKEKLLSLENEGKRLNLKLQVTEGVTDFPIATWLAKKLQLPEESLPVVNLAYRPGTPNNPKCAYLRDVIITLTDRRVCKYILDLAKIRVLLSLYGKQIRRIRNKSREGSAPLETSAPLACAA